MKKLLFTLFFAALNLAAQDKEDYLIENINFFRKSKPNWGLIEPKISTADKERFLTAIFTDTANASRKENWNIVSVEKFLKEFPKEFHFADIDNDGDTDVLLSNTGFPGSEGGDVEIWMNHNNVFRSIINTGGHIAFLNKDRTLVIYKPPCCAMTLNSLCYYAFEKDTIAKESVVHFYRPGFNVEKFLTIIPSSLKKNGSARVKKNSALRFSAQDSVPKNVYVWKTLNVGKVLENATSNVFATFTDSKKQKWCFIKINGPDFMQEYKNCNGAFVGWLKENELQFL